MATINLLPWREELRQVKKREFLEVVVVVLVASLVVVFAWNWVMKGFISNQTDRNNLLTTEISKLEQQVREIEELKKRKQDMLDRMEVIQGLQANRPDIVRMFDEFVRAIPDGVYISELKRSEQSVALVGYAESNNRVSALMRSLDSSYKFSDPNLTKVEANDILGEQGNRFEMRVKLTAPPVAADKENNGEGLKSNE